VGLEDLPPPYAALRSAAGLNFLRRGSSIGRLDEYSSLELHTSSPDSGSGPSHSPAATPLHNRTGLWLHTPSMSLRQLLNQGQALLRRAAAEGTAGGTLQRSAFSTLPDDLATAALKARFPARRPVPSASSAAAGEGAAAGVSPAAAAQQAAAKEVQVGASRSWC
jgi:hypothetical protein